MRATPEMLSVLLIEDEALIGLELCETLVEAGYEVLGPAHTLAGALFLLQQETPRLAIVDIHLRDGPCTEVANQLWERGMLFSSAYTAASDDITLSCHHS